MKIVKLGNIIVICVMKGANHTIIRILTAPGKGPTTTGSGI